MISIGRAGIAAALFAAVAATGCAKKDNYAADTAAASVQSVDTVELTPAGTAADTATKTAASKPVAKTATRKKAPAKTTY